MPIFEYKGLAKGGKNIKGTVDAENARAARVKLKKDGVFVTEIKDKKKSVTKKKKGSAPKGSVNVRELSVMIRQLATLVKANIPLVDCLAILAEQVEHPVLKEALADCKNMVNEGSPLNKALAKYPNVFSNIMISMIEAGEASGSLDNILMRLADFTEASADLKSKVSSALTYPIILLVVVLAIMIALFVYIVPKITEIFETAPELTLPFATIVVINISHFLIDYWIYLIVGVVILYFIFNNWRKSPNGSVTWDSITLKLPLIGPVVSMVAISRFTRTLSTLLAGGVSILMALDIVKNVVNNQIISKAIEETRSNVSEGENFAQPLKRSGFFPPIVVDMIAIGEKTGELENMLNQVSNAYDFQVKAKIDTLTSLITPLVTLFMGAIIFIIVIAVMLPMFQLSDLQN